MSVGSKTARIKKSMATSQIETVSSGADKAKLALAIVLVVLAIGGFYAFPKQGALVQWGVLLVGIAVAAAVFLISEPGKQLVGFAKDSTKEVKKVVWPTRKESVQMTLYVFAFAVTMALFLWLTDKTLEWVFYDLILGWRG